MSAMSHTLGAREFVAALASQLASAVGAATGDNVVAAPGTGADGQGWIVTLSTAGPHHGTFQAWIADESARTVAGAMLGTEAPDDASVADLVRELWTQAGAALGRSGPFVGLKVAIGEVTRGQSPIDGRSTFRLDLGGHGAADVAVSGVFAVERAPAQNQNLELVLDIELPLIVRFGRTTMSFKTLAGLGPGSLIDLGRTPDDPVEMLVGDRVVARGEVVIVGGNYGVRVIDLMSPAERAKALEA
jgi:flagellar motor switch protein FliN